MRLFGWALVRGVVGIVCMVTAPAALAEYTEGEAPAAASVASSGLPSKFTKNLRGFYEFWLQGPSARSLSGDRDGSGTNLSVLHSFSLGYKLRNDWGVHFVQSFSQLIDEKPAAEADPWVANDPYLLLENKSLWSDEARSMNLYGYVRYYLPVSRGTRQSSDEAASRDHGLGTFRFYVNPTKSWLDGRLTLNAIMLAHVHIPSRSNASRLAANGVATREDFNFLFDPILAYTVTPSLEVYLEYASGYLRHTTDGALSKLTHPVDGQYAALGLNILVGKKLLLNPYASLGPVFRGFRNTDFGLVANYTFL